MPAIILYKNICHWNREIWTCDLRKHSLAAKNIYIFPNLNYIQNLQEKNHKIRFNLNNLHLIYSNNSELLRKHTHTNRVPNIRERWQKSITFRRKESTISKETIWLSRRSNFPELSQGFYDWSIMKKILCILFQFFKWENSHRLNIKEPLYFYI